MRNSTSVVKVPVKLQSDAATWATKHLPESFDDSADWETQICKANDSLDIQRDYKVIKMII